MQAVSNADEQIPHSFMNCIHGHAMRFRLKTHAETERHLSGKLVNIFSAVHHLLCKSRFSLLMSEPPLKELCEESLVGASTRSSAFRSFVSSFILCKLG